MPINATEFSWTWTLIETRMRQCRARAHTTRLALQSLFSRKRLEARRITGRLPAGGNPLYARGSTGS